MDEKSESAHKANLERLVEDLKVVVRDGQQLLKAGVTGMKAKAIEQARSAQEIVREKPYQSMAVVFAVGVIVGVVATGLCKCSRGKED